MKTTCPSTFLKCPQGAFSGTEGAFSGTEGAFSGSEEVFQVGRAKSAGRACLWFLVWSRRSRPGPYPPPFALRALPHRPLPRFSYVLVVFSGSVEVTAEQGSRRGRRGQQPHRPLERHPKAGQGAASAQRKKMPQRAAGGIRSVRPAPMQGSARPFVAAPAFALCLIAAPTSALLRPCCFRRSAPILLLALLPPAAPTSALAPSASGRPCAAPPALRFALPFKGRHWGVRPLRGQKGGRWRASGRRSRQGGRRLAFALGARAGDGAAFVSGQGCGGDEVGQNPASMRSVRTVCPQQPSGASSFCAASALPCPALGCLSRGL